MVFHRNMKKLMVPLAMAMAIGCKAPQFVHAGAKNNVQVEYRWNIRPDKPAELLLRIANKDSSAQRIHLGLDLYYQGFTVEEFSADTCIPAGRTFNGRLNGIYFVPERLTAAQAASPDTKVELTEFSAEPTATCP
jgi:hypothetical protein